MRNIRYNVIVTDEDDLSHLILVTSDLNKAMNQLDFVVQASWIHEYHDRSSQNFLHGLSKKAVTVAIMGTTFQGDWCLF